MLNQTNFFLSKREENILITHFLFLPGQAANQSSQAGYGTSAQGQYAPTIAGGQPRPTGMPPQPIPLGGFDMQGYPVDDEEMMKLRAERGGRAGGWSAELGKKRALEEAFGSIWIC